MTKRARAAGNFVSEWYGQRIYPTVRLEVSGVSGEYAGRCPFLSRVLQRSANCVKNSNASGVCSISSTSNGARQDWLVCPYRVIDSNIVRRGCQLIFGLAHEVTPVPVVVLDQEAERRRFADAVTENGTGYLFFQDKLGGEISVIGTARSPEISFDVTLVEIKSDGAGGFVAVRYGILELQTMDYHGTYKHAVDNLRDGLRLHFNAFPDALRANLERWAGDRIEGPNIANVFKRTFYQMLLKFRLASDGSAAAGTVLALPRAVWDSWQPFLGAPELDDEGDGVKRLRPSPGLVEEPAPNAFICVFDLDAESTEAISPVQMDLVIRVTPERMAHHAFTEVPASILRSVQSDDSVLSRIRARLGLHWPAFRSPSAGSGARQSRKTGTPTKN